MRSLFVLLLIATALLQIGVVRADGDGDEDSSSSTSFNDLYWDDLPQAAKNAATILGYDKQKWDNDEPGPYEDRPFEQLTDVEKRAAIYLDLSPFDSHFKDTWWEDLDEDTATYAEILGWGKDEWDGGSSSFDDLDNDWLWNDMTTEQKEAARYFGYTQATWDEDPSVDFEVDYEDRRNY